MLCLLLDAQHRRIKRMNEINKQNQRNIKFCLELCTQEGYKTISDIENTYNIYVLRC